MSRLHWRNYPLDEFRSDASFGLWPEPDRNDFILLDEVARQVVEALDLGFEHNGIDHPFRAIAAVFTFEKTRWFALAHPLELGLADELAQVFRGARFTCAKNNI